MPQCVGDAEFGAVGTINGSRHIMDGNRCTRRREYVFPAEGSSQADRGYWRRSQITAGREPHAPGRGNDASAVGPVRLGDLARHHYAPGLDGEDELCLLTGPVASASELWSR